MSVTIDWLPIAVEQRNGQIDTIAMESPLAAAEQDDEIERQVDQLLDHPKMGRKGRVRGTRELVISGTSFIAVYRLSKLAKQAVDVTILRILHTSQRYP